MFNEILTARFSLKIHEEKNKNVVLSSQNTYINMKMMKLSASTFPSVLLDFHWTALFLKNTIVCLELFTHLLPPDMRTIQDSVEGVRLWQQSAVYSVIKSYLV